MIKASSSLGSEPYSQASRVPEGFSMDLLPDRELQAQAQRWRLHMHQTPLAVIEWDLEGRVRSWNPAAERIFGYGAQEAIGQPIIELIVPLQAEIRERVHQIADGLTQEGRSSRAEHENRRKDGSMILCRWFNTPLTGEDGQPLGVASMALDVTEVQRANQALVDSEQRFRTIFEKAIDGIIIFSLEGQLLDLNDAFATMHGRTRAEMRGLPIFDMSTPMTNAMVPERMRRMMAGETLKVELEQIHKDGHAFLTEATASLATYAGQPAILSFHRDITDRKQSEMALLASEERLRLALEATSDGVWDWEVSTGKTYYSPAYTRMLGYELDEFATQISSWSNLILPEDRARVLASNEACIQGAFDSFEAEFRMRARDGSTKWIRGRGKAISRDGQGRALRIVGTHQDVTERRESEDLLRESEERFRQISSSMLDIAYSCIRKPGGPFVIDWMIGATEVLFGRSIEESKAARCWGNFVVEADRPLFSEQVLGLAAGKSGTCELCLQKKDGGLTWVHSYAHCEASPEGLGQHRLFGALVEITGRKQAEEKLQKRELQLRESQAAALIGNWSVDVPTDTLEWSDETFRRFDKDPATFKTSVEYFVSRIHPDDLAAAQRAMREALENQAPYHLQTRILNETGRQWVMEAFGVVEWDRDGKPLRFSGTAQDITKRKQEEEELLLKRSLMEKVSDGLFIVDPTSRRILDVNETTCAQLGYAKEELLELRVEDLDPVMSVDQWSAHLEEVRGAAEGLTLETRHRTKEGSWLPVELRVRHVTLGDRSYLITSARDITERKQSEEALRISEERNRAVTQSAHDAIVTINHLGKIIGWNHGAERIFGYQASEIIDQPLTLLMPVRHQALHLFGERGVNSGRAPNVRGVPTELQGVHKDGSEFPVEVSLSKWGSTDAWFVTGIIRDITERKRSERQNASLQAQLQQAQKMESLGTLSGGIAHDMNNVLGAILGLASANIEIQPPGSPAYRSFETIIKAATRGGEMVRSLLAFARQSQAEDRVLDVNTILQEQAHLLERTTLSRVRLVMDLDPGLQPIRGDANALINAFMNLCVNAVDAMPENGTLTLCTRNLDGAWIEVIVADTGIGMPREVMDRAMEPFFTTKEVGKGTGLGLSMVYSTVRAHRGQIELHSTSGEGTQVKMRFPACEPAAGAMEPTAGAGSEASQEGMNVLLVDDDELIQSSVETILQTLGHAVLTSASGEEALASLEAGFEADVVILDMNMPGLGGAGTLPRLRALLPKVPVLLSTGRTDQAALDLAEAHPLVTLLPKPFTIKELQQCLAALGRN